ncbi:hypothetical protein N2152v2_007567 [Parachlorella kessleri]
MRRQLPSLALHLRSLLQQQSTGSAAAAAVGGVRALSELALRNNALKAGGGGRSSVNGVTVTIFGCTGFLGRYVAQSLGKGGSQLVLPYRCDDVDMQHLRTMGDLGMVVPLKDFDFNSEEAIRKAVARSNVVINLIGAQQETWNYSFEDVNVAMAHRIAKVVRESPQVERFLHVSALGAAPNAPSKRLRTKYDGETAVKAEAPHATIFRPALMTGTEDKFFNNYAQLVKRMPFVPLIDGGDTKLQPVWVRDVADGIVTSLFHDESKGQTYHLGGPQVYTVKQLLKFVHDTIREPYRGVYTPAAAAKLFAKPFDFMAKKSPFRSNYMFSQDYIDELTYDLVVPESGVLTFKELDIAPASVTEGVPVDYLRFYRVGGYDFGTTAGSEAVGGGGFGSPGVSKSDAAQP